MALPKPIKLRIILIVVVFLVLLIASVGYFWSDWIRTNEFQGCSGIPDCPDIGMERFYLAMLVFSLLGTIVSVLLEYFNTNNNKWIRLGDFIFHTFLGFLLLIGVITFFVSTLQVKDIFDDENEKSRQRNADRKKEAKENAGNGPQREVVVYEEKEYDEYYQWIIKLIASIFGIGVVVFHEFIAFLIGKPLFQEVKQGADGNAEEGAASQSGASEPLEAGSRGQESTFKAEPEGQRDPR